MAEYHVKLDMFANSLVRAEHATTRRELGARTSDVRPSQISPGDTPKGFKVPSSEALGDLGGGLANPQSFRRASDESMVPLRG
jgi:hypothetical protein